MTLDDILRTFWARPIYQRFFLAFTVGLFLSCGARMAEGQDAAVSTQGTARASTLQPMSSGE